MAKNERCPLQAECERKCAHKGHELDCDYYCYNAREELVIEDQEEIRRAREREQEERWYAENFSDDEDEDLGDEEPDGGLGQLVENTEEIAEPLPNDSEIQQGNMVYLPIEQLYPHPDNPRKALGDLTELADSIKANGVFQNLTVVPGHWVTMEEYVRIAKAEGVPKSMATASYEPKAMWEESGYTIIIGHRRRAAAELAGLGALPCVVTGLSEREQVATMLLENMQRSDLTVYEQAQGFQMMIDLGDTPEGIAEKTGLSKATVGRRLKMAMLDQKELEKVASRQISLEDFDRLAKIEDLGKRNEVLASMGTNNFESSWNLAMRRQEVGKKLPLAHAVVKDLNAKRLQKYETWNGKYQQLGKEISLRDWDGDVPVKDDEKRKLFYTLDEDFGKLSFYVKAPGQKAPKKTKEQKAREARIDEAHRELKEMNELHYKLRKDFVENMGFSNKQRMPITLGALLACAGHGVLYLGPNREDMRKLLCLKDSYSDRKGSLVAKMFDGLAPEQWPRIIHASLGDDASKSYGSTYNGQFPKHQSCDELDLTYKWLAWCGYEMSDDEIALQNGTHEVLHRGEEKK